MTCEFPNLFQWSLPVTDAHPYHTWIQYCLCHNVGLLLCIWLHWTPSATQSASVALPKTVLWIRDELILVQVIHHLISENRLHHLANLAGKANWTIIVSFMSADFLEQRCDICRSPVSRNTTCIHGFAENIATGSAVSSLTAFNIHGDMLSTPAALSTFNVLSLLLIMSVSTL